MVLCLSIKELIYAASQSSSQKTAKMYSSFLYENTDQAECEAFPTARSKVIILGGDQTELVKGLNSTIAVYTRVMLYLKPAMKP